MRIRFAASLALAFGASPALAEEDLEQRARRALARATSAIRALSTGGGYAGIMSPDGAQRFGEARHERVAPGEIWVQPPGTPTVGQVFLRAHAVTHDPEYLEAATEAGLALAWGQRRAGGWDHRVKVAHRREGKAPQRKRGRCTFDDEISQGALAFLIELDAVVDADWLTASIELSRAHLREAQLENGAWPQWFPLIGGYHDHATFNDGAINDCITVLLEAHRVYEDSRDLRAAIRGGDFILASPVSPEQPGWAQQYGQDGEPARARSFEPPAVCSAVTARNICTLIELFLVTGERRFLAPIPAAIGWLEASTLRSDTWARLYELGTNRPIYGDRDGEIHYALEEISEERRKGYAWEGSFGVPKAIRAYRELEARGFEPPPAKAPPSAAERRERAARLEGEVRALIEALDDGGLWVESGWVTTKTFVRNARRLCDYIAGARRWF